MERVTACHFHVNCQYGVVARSGTSNEALTSQPLVLIFSRGFPKSTHPHPLELGRVSIRTIDDPSRHLQRNSVVARLYLVLCNSLARRIAGPRVSQLPAFIPTIWGCLLLLAPSQALCCNSCHCTEYFAVFFGQIPDRHPSSSRLESRTSWPGTTVLVTSWLPSHHFFSCAP